MADTFASEQPPAKRVRLEAPVYRALDAPDSPIDDDDEDFYGTTPVKPSSPHVFSLDSAASPASAMPSIALTHTSMHLPGLGFGSDAHKSPTAAIDESANHFDAEEGEISDSGSLYDDSKPSEAEGQKQLKDNGSGTNFEAVSAPGARPPNISSITGADTLKDNDPSMRSVAEQNTGTEKGKAEYLRAAAANKGDQNAEWQVDSSAEESSSDSSSDDTSGDDSDEEQEGVDESFLSPEELAKRLIQLDEVGSPISGPAKIRTVNEVVEEYKKPDIIVTENTKITELGAVETIVDNVLLIKGKESAEQKVLEPGSALCLADRTILGVVSEAMGRVHEPRYSLGFSERSDITTNKIEKGTPIYYIDEHSILEDTSYLKNIKHTDASNIHDEEAGEVEFSDDEKEAEYKRQQKQAKQEKKDQVAEKGPPQSQSKGGYDAPSAPRPGQYQGGGLNYDDDDDGDLGMYRPLTRPDNLHMISGNAASIEDRSHVRGRNQRPHRGRGMRGRGGGGGRGGNQFSRGPDRPAARQEQNRHEHNRQQNRQEPNRSKHNTSHEQKSKSANPPSQKGKNRRRDKRSPAGANRGQPHPTPAPPAQTSGVTTTNAQAYAFNATAGWQNSTNATSTRSASSHDSTTNLPGGAHVNPAFQQSATAAPSQADAATIQAWAQWMLQMQQWQQQAQNPHQVQAAHPSSNAAPQQPQNAPQANNAPNMSVAQILQQLQQQQQQRPGT